MWMMIGLPLKMKLSHRDLNTTKMICLNINIAMGTTMRLLGIQFMMTQKYIQVG